MTPGARISATIELLELIEESTFTSENPASNYFRRRRYIGSSDRRSINERVFRILRRRARLNWLSGNDTVRGRVITDLFLFCEKSEDLIKRLFSGKNYNPSPLTEAEISLFTKLKGGSYFNASFPEEVKAELPKWIYEILICHWEDNFQTETNALNQSASTFLRVNTIKTNINNVQRMLAKNNIASYTTSLSPLALKLETRKNLENTIPFRNGLIEIQDEGSQLLAAVVDTKPKYKTIDLCAGAGGKTLALGASMKNLGSLFACDTNLKRLNKLKLRLRRSGLTNVSVCHLSDNNTFFKKHEGTSERVLVDVPCSGSGTWRRTPYKKWQITETELDSLINLQKKIMKEASSLVSNGGRLIYATCSILPVENEKQVDWFLSQYTNFRIVSVKNIWLQIFGQECPENVISCEGYLSLTPARHDTDGFFAAILEKKIDHSASSQ